MDAINQTKAEIAHFGVVERYINDLRSKATGLTDDEFTLIAGNLRGFYATILPMGPNEPATMSLLKEAETAIEEYSCRTPVPHIATEMGWLAARIRAFMSDNPVQTSDRRYLDALESINAVGVDFGHFESAARTMQEIARKALAA